MNRKKAFQYFKSPVSKAPGTTLRSILPHANKNQATVLTPEGAVDATVFYFPGCGSERVFSTISKACLFMLLENHTRIILPPPYLCCGYPFLVNARKKAHDKIVLETVIILTQIRDMFRDLTMDACMVSCGTCMEALNEIQVQKIFDCPVQDISDYILKKDRDIRLEQDYLYHTPCHDSLKAAALTLLDPLCRNNNTIQAVPHCCSEAGTLALSRPDIANAMLVRKQNSVSQAAAITPAKILTNCPSCIQGLGRQRQAVPIHLAQELARIKGGDDWAEKLLPLIQTAEVVTF
jgi:Fe-S oxidoreductase